jgi:hypothetical protein
VIDQPFAPRYGATVVAATAAGAVNVNVPTDSKNLLIVNDGTGVVMVRVKPSGQAGDATATDCPVAKNSSRVITKDPGSQGVVSVWSPGGAVGNVYICPGEGWGGQ